MAIYKGGDKVLDLKVMEYYNLQDITAVYVGDQKVYPESAPLVTLQPTNQTAIVGNDLTFTCSFSSEVALTYQWYKKIVGEDWTIVATDGTSTTLVKEATENRDGALWRCTATDVYDQTTTTNEVSSTVDPIPQGEQLFTSSGTFVAPS